MRPGGWLRTITHDGSAARRDVYEHPWPIRLTHWLNAVALVVMTGSGLQILTAFPAFGPKIPQHDLVNVPEAVRIGGWLGGALQWHFTFMWIFVATGALYLISQLVTGRHRMVLFVPKDAPGVWPMARHYFFFGRKPRLTEPYNPLQKLAYTGTLIFAIVSVLSGLVMYKPAQFSSLELLLGGYHNARVIHFLAMCGILSFVPGHLTMVALHGWDNFRSMLTGWKHRPEYPAMEMEE